MLSGLFKNKSIKAPNVWNIRWTCTSSATESDLNKIEIKIIIENISVSLLFAIEKLGSDVNSKVNVHLCNSLRGGFIKLFIQKKMEKSTVSISKVEHTAYLYLHISVRSWISHYAEQIKAEILFALTSTFSLKKYLFCMLMNNLNAVFLLADGLFASKNCVMFT